MVADKADATISGRPRKKSFAFFASEAKKTRSQGFQALRGCFPRFNHAGAGLQKSLLAMAAKIYQKTLSLS